MTMAELPLRLAHIASLHCGEPTFRADLMRNAVDAMNRLRPDLVMVAGDLTASGYEWEYDEALDWLDRIDAPRVVVPGNHDARNVGYIHFERHHEQRFVRYRLDFDDLRAERLGTTGVTVVGVDSSEPDLDEGRVGREWYPWIREQFDRRDDLNIFLIHHHLVSVPGAGRGLNVITDAGDVLPILADIGIDLVLSGHMHVPYFWGLNGMLLCNAGTVSTQRVRGMTPPSWNELRVDASTVKVFLHYGDRRRELAAIRSRASRAMIRESFYLSDDFLTSNSIPLG